MVIDRLIEEIKAKQNPCIVGIDPEWDKVPECYRRTIPAEGLQNWAMDVMDAVADIVPAIKPQMAFFEVFGYEGLRVHQNIVEYAHAKGLVVVDDSKRNDIGNTARAYAQAHLAADGPINADFMTISPFLGSDSMQPFVDVAIRDGKGLFVLVKTSNPSSVEISEAINPEGKKISDYLSDYVFSTGQRCIGKHGYASVGAVVGATFPEEALELRKRMPRSFFLVPGFGTQGGRAKDVIPCFNPDGLGAIVSSSRGIIYAHEKTEEFDGSRKMYMDIVRVQAETMKKDVYAALKYTYPNMIY